MPRIPQDQAYHQFADARAWLGVPNFLNVISNLPFTIVGLLGLALTARPPSHLRIFMDPWERFPYAALFAGIFLTSLGSSFYHLDPSDYSLFFDRLPIAIGFMGLLTAVLAERVSVSLGKRVFLPLLLLAAVSVVHW
jgi:hypothetical protein